VDVVIANGRRLVPDEMRALIEEKVVHLGHLCPGLDRAQVSFTEEHNRRIPDRERCEVVMQGHGRVLRAHAAARDPLVAVDLVVEKLEHQLEKQKGRLVGRSHPRHRASPRVRPQGRREGRAISV
jgi:ribosomal subunit interface protein